VDGEASRRFWIENDAFWKDGEQFQIVGGDVHYFRIVPEVSPYPGSSQYGLQHLVLLVEWSGWSGLCKFVMARENYLCRKV
jgi:hypothetical protein